MPDIAARDCILFLWSTAPLLAECMEVVSAWGFQYKSCAVWDKQRIGMGHYFRIDFELLLIATRGSPGTPPDSLLQSSIISGEARPALEVMTTDAPEPRFERCRLTYSSGTVVMAFYADGATLGEVRVTHPMAVAEAVEDSRVSVRMRRVSCQGRNAVQSGDCATKAGCGGRRYRANGQKRRYPANRQKVVQA